MYQPRAADLSWELELRHLDEAEFALGVWDDALDAPNYTLDELARGPERRLLAHVDALRVGGPIVADRLLAPTLRDATSYAERLAAAVLACADGSAAVSALAEADDEDHRRGLVHGLELRCDPGLDGQLVEAIEAADARTTAALLELLARRGVTVGEWLAPSLGRPEPEIQAAAAWLARYTDDPRVLKALGPLVHSDNPEVRLRAIETGLLRRVPGAWESARSSTLSDRPSPTRRQVLVWVAQLGGDAGLERLLELLERPAYQADVLWALSFGGRVAAIERSLPLLDHAELGPLAGELVCAITGLATDDQRYWRASPRADELDASLPALSAETLDEDLSLSPEQLLPIPEPAAIMAWWREREADFDPRLRYLDGRPFTAATVLDALRDAPLRRRHDLAFELGVRSAGACLVPTRALASVQAQHLAELERRASSYDLDFQRELAR